ncbi:ankyrin repeat-containing domain, PGG domain protein [Tanacetum coccineum]
MEQEMVHLPTINEQSPEDGHVIAIPPVARSRPNLPCSHLLDEVSTQGLFSFYYCYVSVLSQKGCGLMDHEASVQLATIIEQSPEDNVIVELPPLARLGPYLPCLDLLLEGNRDKYIEFGIPLYEASINADWKAAKEILDKKPDLIRSSITENGETALHVAASAKRTKQVAEFVQNLVDMMQKADLELQNKSYNTALCLAAAAGNLEMVDIMLQKNKALLSIRGSQEMMPLYMASLFGEHDVVKYLFDKSNGLRDDGWDAKNRAWLLQKCVEGEMFDIALQMVKDHKELASDGEVLRILAKKPDAFVEKSSNIIRKTVNWVFAFICPKEGHPQKDTEALQLLRIIWKDIVKKPKKAIDDMIRGPADVIKKEDRLPYGKEEQQVHLLKLIADHVIKIPAELQKINGGTSANISITPSMKNAKKTYSLRTLFIAAEMGNTKFIVELIRQYPDLIWKEVESMIPPYYRKRKNKDGLTPHELFTKEHKDLVAKGEDWMKGTASQFMVVAELLATIVFAAAFTVPGSYNQTNGIPIFKSESNIYCFCSGRRHFSFLTQLQS